MHRRAKLGTQNRQHFKHCYPAAIQAQAGTNQCSPQALYQVTPLIPEIQDVESVSEEWQPGCGAVVMARKRLQLTLEMKICRRYLHASDACYVMPLHPFYVTEFEPPSLYATRGNSCMTTFI